MAGLGSRFPSNKYPLPKPLIQVNDKPMILSAIESLDLDGRYLYVIAKNEYSKTIKDILTKFNSNSYFVEIDYLTEGPAVSSLLFTDLINNDDELVIANCDQIMEWSGNMFLNTARLFDGTVVTYHTSTEKNSYARIDKKGYVSEIREKEVISNISLNGIHYWKRGNFFVDSANKMINSQDRASNGEFYIGPTYNYMIKKGLKVGIYHIPNQQHHAVGVPSDLDAYLNNETL